MTSRPVSTGVLLLTLVSLAGCSRSGPEERDRLVASGDRYLGEKKFSEATIEYRKALQEDPDFGPTYSKLGDAYAQVGDPREALWSYVRAADLQPDSAAANLRAGNLLLVARRFQDAKARARNILQKDPNNVAALVLLGNSLAGQQNLDEAVDVVTRAIALDPSSSTLLANVGVLEIARGNFEAAETAFLKGIAVDPKSVSPLLALANLYDSWRRPADAERVLRKALELEPDNINANASLALTLVHGRRPFEAEPFLKRAADAAGSIEASLGLADYYVAVGRTAEALALLARLSESDEGYVAGRIRTAIIDHASGRFEQAHAKLKEVLAHDPRNVSAMALESRLYLSERRFDEAAKSIGAALTIDPRSPQAYTVLGRIHLAKGATEDARRAFLDALNRDPHQADALVELSKIHATRKEFDTAIRYAETAVKNDPQSLEARLTLVRALAVRPDDFPRVEGQLKALLTIHSSAPEVHTLAGRVALQKNNRSEARAAFERAVALDPDSVEALSGLSVLDMEQGRKESARARIEARLAAHERPSAEMLLLAAKVYTVTGEVDKVEHSLRRITELEPSNVESFSLLGQFYVARKQMPEAIRQFQQVTKQDPKNAGAQTMLAQLLETQGDKEGAKKAYEAAVRADARSAMASNNLAWMLANEEHGDLDEALQLAQNARSLMPTSPRAADTLAFIYYKKQLSTFATTLLEQAIQQEPRNALYHYHLGLVLAQAGEDAKARRSLQAALKLNPLFPDADHARQVMATLVY